MGFCIEKVTGIMTQGRADGKEWVLTYLVSHSMDAFHWKYCTDAYGSRKVTILLIVIVHFRIETKFQVWPYLRQGIETKMIFKHI